MDSRVTCKEGEDKEAIEKHNDGVSAETEAAVAFTFTLLMHTG
jgi:hypothetical protein